MVHQVQKLPERGEYKKRIFETGFPDTHVLHMLDGGNTNAVRECSICLVDLKSLQLVQVPQTFKFTIFFLDVSPSPLTTPTSFYMFSPFINRKLSVYPL